MNRTVLVTGFEPFGGDATNPSAQLVDSLRGCRIDGREVHGVVLPVAFGASRRQLRSAITKTDPELVICLGLAASRKALSLERVAVNLNDARIPDNTGQQPIDEPVIERGPNAYFTTLPIKQMAAVLRKMEAPVELSNTAGNYVCNHVFYCLMHRLRRRIGSRGGFIHVPPFRSDFDRASQTAALVAAIAAALRNQRDLQVPAGIID